MEKILLLVFLFSINDLSASNKSIPNFDGIYEGPCSINHPIENNSLGCIATFNINQQGNQITNMKIDVRVNGQIYFELSFTEHLIVGTDLIDPIDNMDVGDIGPHGFYLARSEDNKLEFNKLINGYELIGLSRYYGAKIHANLTKL